MDLGFNLAPSNRDLKDPTSRQNFGDTSGLLCKNDPILRLILILILVSALILMPTLLLPQDLQLPYLVVMTDLGAKIFSNCFPS